MNKMNSITLPILNIFIIFQQMNVDQKEEKCLVFYISYDFRITRLKFNIYFIFIIRD